MATITLGHRTCEKVKFWHDAEDTDNLGMGFENGTQKHSTKPIASTGEIFPHS